MSSQELVVQQRSSNDQALALTQINIKTERERQLAREQLATLAKIDQLAESYQEEGKMMDALLCMEKSLILRGHCFGLESIEVYEACRTVGEMCNLLASASIQQDKLSMALELLTKAEVLTERHPNVRAVTFNNMCCFYRHKGKLRTALSYIERAIAIESKLHNDPTIRHADTHLNACTVLSDLHRHESALKHAKIALRYLLRELFGHHNNPYKVDENASPEEVEQTQKPDLPHDRVAVLAIAYHNLAVQQEYLRQYSASLESYEKAYKVCFEYLGEEHGTTMKMQSSLEGAKTKMQPILQSMSKLNFVKRQTMPTGPAQGPKLLQRKELQRLQNNLKIERNELDYTGLEDI